MVIFSYSGNLCKSPALPNVFNPPADLNIELYNNGFNPIKLSEYIPISGLSTSLTSFN
jgi:hypothetical protein